ncbi:LexA repressor [Caballeronia sp. SBC1]|uniref:LexA family protein n=1 Tax=Caballeronia sp. SBC1 TaxID=2705548 RepID=UPI00140D3C20|nr:S24 family peptidase [Caballeronia sp. SBC1]QIN62481.1 LexA repressor [Caballeronia sp. SBC1]
MNKSVSSEYFLRVVSDSMYDPADRDSFAVGDFILVRPQSDAENGSVVVVESHDGAWSTFRQLVTEGGTKYLKALNPSWSDRMVEMSDDLRICGVVTMNGRARSTSHAELETEEVSHA